MSSYVLVEDTGTEDALKARVKDESFDLPALYQDCEENPDRIANWKALAAYFEGEAAFIKSMIGD